MFLSVVFVLHDFNWFLNCASFIFIVIFLFPPTIALLFSSICAHYVYMEIMKIPIRQQERKFGLLAKISVLTFAKLICMPLDSCNSVDNRMLY